VAIIHSEPEVIAARYPEARHPERRPGGREPEGPEWPLAAFRSRLAREYHARTFGEGYESAWKRLRPALDVAECVRPDPPDYIVTQQEQVEALLKQRGILNLLYVGFVLNFCLLEKPGGILRMRNRYRTILLRDCTAASEVAWSTEESLMTKAFIHWLEVGGTLTATSGDLLRLLGAA
jgi:nicotinamidase-related amidase